MKTLYEVCKPRESIFDELSKKNVEEVYKLKEYYIENIKTSLIKYSRFDPLKII